MNEDQHFKVVSVSALCMVHYLNDSARLGWAMRQAVVDNGHCAANSRVG